LVSLVDEAADNDHDGSQSSKIIMRMIDLFDFSKDHWVKFQEASAVGSLEEELELYQLLDLDVPGDPELDLDLNDSIENILTF
jgi:hypothetical protein